jgi:hypothetical protein
LNETETADLQHNALEPFTATCMITDHDGELRRLGKPRRAKEQHEVRTYSTVDFSCRIVRKYRTYLGSGSSLIPLYSQQVDDSLFL